VKYLARKIQLEKVDPSSHLTVFAFGDLHADSPAFDEQGFKRFLDDVKSTDGPTVSICIGDLVDFTNTRSRKSLTVAFGSGVVESVRADLDAFADQKRTAVQELLRPIAHTIVIGMEGNHGWVFEDGTTLDERVAASLKYEHASGLAALRFTLRSGHRQANLHILAHHGLSGGSTAGVDLNSLLRKFGPYANCHIGLSGHTHRLYVHHDNPSLLLPDGGSYNYVKQADRHYARTGSFVRGYIPNATTYVEAALLPPTSLGYVKFRASLHSDVNDHMSVRVRGEAIEV
jgi:hypothetical protein